MLMLAVQTMQAILKDVQMREQAHLIQGEVAKLMDDMGRFRERVLDLQRHFGQANQDIEKILTSSEKIAAARATRSRTWISTRPRPRRRSSSVTVRRAAPSPQPSPQRGSGRAAAQRRAARDPPAGPAGGGVAARWKPRS